MAGSEVSSPPPSSPLGQPPRPSRWWAVAACVVVLCGTVLIGGYWLLVRAPLVAAERGIDLFMVEIMHMQHKTDMSSRRKP